MDGSGQPLAEFLSARRGENGQRAGHGIELLRINPGKGSAMLRLDREGLREGGEAVPLPSVFQELDALGVGDAGLPGDRLCPGLQGVFPLDLGDPPFLLRRGIRKHREDAARDGDDA